MVVSTTPEGSTFKPMTEAAKEVAKFLREEYAKTPITKPELVQTMDSSKIIEGPSPEGSAVEKKVANLALLEPQIVETKNLPVLSISEVLLSEFSNDEFRNVLSFKASSFISDQTQSSFNFEIKGVRAIWDPSLSIPGTNRRGGFRCPVGTRYGGQITDRFGRSCGWGVARRIANQIADIGERLEQRDDDKRKRRLDRRNARMMRRLGGVPETGRLEGGLRGIADRLEGVDAPKPLVGRGEGREFAAEVFNASNVGRVVNAVRGRRRRGDAQEEVDAPSARVPQNRRRDVIPQTAPTPTPKPRPARRPSPAGQRRPQARPRVAPQAENVDVLTARDASDASATEDFSPYVLRKYGEYAKRVREIRAGGGNAGMLTRREWYAINKPNLREAWKDAHGRSAPQDFEPPTPQARRPRNNRGRRKKATTAGAARSATRKPQANDVPEPAPTRPARPARGREPIAPQGDGNLRESEQRRMDREIVEPGAPRTGEAPARRRRRAVDQPVVEPKVVKPRRPKKNPEGDMGAMLNAESEQRRVPKPARRGDSDNAARSEELRQNRQAMEEAVLADAKKRERARAAGRKVDLNQILNERFFGRYVREDIIPNDRIMIINDPANFPISRADQKTKRAEALQKINKANASLDKIEQAIARGELSDNDFIERNGEKVNVARVKTYIKDFRDAWQEVHDTNLSGEPPKGATPKPNPIDDPFNAPSIVKPKGAQNAPKEIAYEPLKFEPAFKTERNNILEEKLLAIADPKELAEAIAAIDKLKFNHGEAQQSRLNRHHDELAKAINEIASGAKTFDQALASWRRTQETNFGTDERLSQIIAERQASYENQWNSVVRDGNLESKINNLNSMNQRLVESKTTLALRKKFEKDLRDALARKDQGFVVNEDDTNFAKITPDNVKKQIDGYIKKAISKRGKKLDEYLKQRFPEGGAVPKFKDMTPEKWSALNPLEKRSYIEEAYSHPMIKGKNGKLYRVKVTEFNDNRGEINVRTSFDEIDANGNVLRSGIAGSYRTIYTGDAKKVYQNSFFIRSDIDKAADLATIYNQTAFTYLKAIGINKASVGPADDGRYVWARVGFKERGGLSSSHYNRLDSALKFYKDFGVGGLVANDEQYIRLKKLVEAGKNGRKFNHQDAIFLIDDGNITDKARREYIKHWFATNVPLSSATLSFSEQKIGEKVR